MRFSIPAVAFFCSFSYGALLHAQYDEAGAVVLFQKTIGVSRELFGWSVVGIGDVNGDGTIDLAVGSTFASGLGGSSSAGRVYALSGADGSTLWSRMESRQSAILGYSLEAMDWDGDGRLDVVSGAPFADEGRTWVFSGVDGSTLAELIGPHPGSGFGASVATGGDFDGNGVEDLLVAAPFFSNVFGTDIGVVHVFERGSTSPFATVSGQTMDAEFGLGLAFLGDTTQPPDGRDEVVIGYRTPGSFFDGFVDAVGWNGTDVVPRFTVGGVGMGYQLLGDRVDGGGDVNGDGVPDFLVGDTFLSEVEVFSGTDGALLHRFVEEGDLGPAHFLTDVDHDDRADVVAGAWKNESAAPDGGKIFVYSGATGAILKTITSTTDEQNLGIDAREIGDFNGDGRTDLVVGAYGDGFNGPLPGGAWVFSGHLSAPINRFGPAQRPGDPVLFDNGGDPETGPLIGSLLEPFNLSLSCTNAAAPGPFAIEVRAGRLASPMVTGIGWAWTSGPLLYRCGGVQTQNVVECAPGGLRLPSSLALVGITYTAQGICGWRFSTAVTQTIGR